MDQSNVNDYVGLNQRIGAERKGLSKALRKTADFLLADPADFITTPLRQLSQKVGVSEPTLIRFARLFGFPGMPEFRLALAMSLAADDRTNVGQLEPLLGDKQIINRSLKKAIAQRCVDLTRGDRSLILDSGSTLQQLAEELTVCEGKTVMTASLVVAQILRNASQHRVMMTGGTLRGQAMTLAGPMAERSMEGLRFDTVYLGADSLHPDHGLGTFNEEEAELNRALIKASKRVVVLADSSKFGGLSLHTICDLNAIDIIVSDTGLSGQQVREIENRGPRLILADEAELRGV